MRWLANPWILATTVLVGLIAIRLQPEDPIHPCDDLGVAISGAPAEVNVVTASASRVVGKMVRVHGQRPSIPDDVPTINVSAKTHFCMMPFGKSGQTTLQPTIYCAFPPGKTTLPSDFLCVQGTLRVVRMPSGNSAYVIDSTEVAPGNAPWPSPLNYPPLIIAALLAQLIYAFAHWMRRWPNPALVEDRKCSQCGYDIRASPQRCPECGAWNGERIRRAGEVRLPLPSDSKSALPDRDPS